MLGRDYRFVYYNATGVTIAAGAITTTARRENFSSSGVLTPEAAQATIDSGLASVGTPGYLHGTAQNNSAAGTAFLGGDFTFVVTAPTGASGPVTVYLQRSTDGGTTWPDDGDGDVVKVIKFGAAGTETRGVRI